MSQNKQPQWGGKYNDGTPMAPSRSAAPTPNNHMDNPYHLGPNDSAPMNNQSGSPNSSNSRRPAAGGHQSWQNVDYTNAVTGSGAVVNTVPTGGAYGADEQNALRKKKRFSGRAEDILRWIPSICVIAALGTTWIILTLSDPLWRKEIIRNPTPSPLHIDNNTPPPPDNTSSNGSAANNSNNNNDDNNNNATTPTTDNSSTNRDDDNSSTTTNTNTTTLPTSPPPPPPPTPAVNSSDSTSSMSSSTSFSAMDVGATISVTLPSSLTADGEVDGRSTTSNTNAASTASSSSSNNNNNNNNDNNNNGAGRLQSDVSDDRGSQAMAADAGGVGGVFTMVPDDSSN